METSLKIVQRNCMETKKEPPTEKQKEYISLIESVEGLPKFIGITKKEASLYIAKYGKRISVNSWTIKRGY